MSVPDLTAGQWFALYATIALSFLLLDLLWLGVLARGFYRRAIGPQLREPVRWPVAWLFYLGYTLAILLLVVAPTVPAGDASQVAWRALVFALITYGTYDLTNWATLQGWSARLTAVDLAWGVALNTTVALVAYGVAHRVT
jgi:uncharacterized membrane protein